MAMIMNIDRVIEIVEDHAVTNNFICSVYRSLCNGTPLPEEVPTLHDLIMTDVLSMLCERINELRKNDGESDNRHRPGS